MPQGPLCQLVDGGGQEGTELTLRGWGLGGGVQPGTTKSRLGVRDFAFLSSSVSGQKLWPGTGDWERA
jgi:hypothetical protein